MIEMQTHESGVRVIITILSNKCTFHRVSNGHSLRHQLPHSNPNHLPRIRSESDPYSIREHVAGNGQCVITVV